MNYQDLDRYLQNLSQEGKLQKVPNVSPQNGRFLHDLISAVRPKSILEIGTANGYSTLWFARALQGLESTGHQGGIITLEFSQHSQEEASGHFQATGMDRFISSYFADARVLLKTPEFIETYSFDFIFIDGHKKDTLQYFLAILPLAKPGAVIIIDDVVKFAHKMQDFYEYLQIHSIPYTILPTDPDDGVLFIVLSPDTISHLN